ncbi:uncharacterized protein LOC126854812 [Cataglyphis hispanica]|uniref:uncharacterized protein LOC126854812 n=1 Tax=Cataglyphis hispanica TaxID=1086592 RepID=UPI00217F4471|nr:uncharacterized protein LOC126854812 [Cataglyphis hispanica]
MFPAEKPALLNTIARGLTGHSIDTDVVFMYNLLDETSLNKIAENAASRVWFVTFDSATAGIFGILVVIRIIKIVVDTAIHGYALHTAYGWSLHLLGAIWSSLTHLLLHLARGPINKDDNNKDDISSPSAPEEPPLLPLEPPATDCSLKISENAGVNIESATIEIDDSENHAYKNLRDRLKDLEQITTKNRNLFLNKGRGVTSCQF